MDHELRVVLSAGLSDRCYMFHIYTILDLGGHAWPKQDISCFIYSFQYQSGLRVLALSCEALALQVQLHDFL